jgi:hypothetical protein
MTDSSPAPRSVLDRIVFSPEDLALLDEALLRSAYSLEHGRYEFGGEDEGRRTAKAMRELRARIKQAT